jgi:hypothetical protein
MTLIFVNRHLHPDQRATSRLPSFLDGPESIGKDRECDEHRGEPLDQRQ